MAASVCRAWRALPPARWQGPYLGPIATIWPEARRSTCAERCARRRARGARVTRELAQPSQLCLGVEGATLVLACLFFAPRDHAAAAHWHICKPRKRPLRPIDRRG